MFIHRSKIIFVAGLILTLANILSAEEARQVSNGQQLLLLRNGQALVGEITQTGNSYRVLLPTGEIRVKASDVEFVCQTLEEGYQRKHAAIQVDSLRDHLELAQWCERHKLYDHAAAELADAAAIAPKNPLVGVMRRRMQLSKEPLESKFNTGVIEEQIHVNEELDRMVRDVPQKAIEEFTQSVQPLLINNCTSSGCHGPYSTTNLKLERVTSGESTGRRLTQRNFQAVMQYVDRKDPLSSKLLIVPIAPHGTAKAAIFNERQIAQYKHLVDWVRELSLVPNARMPAYMEAETPPAEAVSPTNAPSGVPRLLPNDPRRARSLSSLHKNSADEASDKSWMENQAAARDGETKSAAFQEPVKDKSETEKSDKTEKDRPVSHVKRGAQSAEYSPKDAFDPEVFNRRYANSQNSEKTDSDTATDTK